MRKTILRNMRYTLRIVALLAAAWLVWQGPWGV
jgi:hypothetical protein